MLGAIKRALGVGAAEPCAGCDPAVLAQCSAAEPGSVTPHSHHVFIKLLRPAGADTSATDEAWWAEKVDGEPAIASVNAAIKAAGDTITGKVKVTAFDFLTPAPLAQGTADCFVFPAGLHFRGLPLDQLPAAVVAALAGSGGDAGPAKGDTVEGTTLFVCCHTARDARCGHIGPPLADKLAELAAAKLPGGNGSLAVLKTSHIGGHVYAGNVLVYSKGKSTDGDWFGGLHPGNAEAFLDALLAAKAPSGAAGETALRPWWRGRVGLSKPQQVALFKSSAAVRDIEELVQ